MLTFLLPDYLICSHWWCWLKQIIFIWSFDKHFSAPNIVRLQQRQWIWIKTMGDWLLYCIPTLIVQCSSLSVLSFREKRGNVEGRCQDRENGKVVDKCAFGSREGEGECQHPQSLDLSTWIGPTNGYQEPISRITVLALEIPTRLRNVPPMGH